MNSRQGPEQLAAHPSNETREEYCLKSNLCQNRIAKHLRAISFPSSSLEEQSLEEIDQRTVAIQLGTGSRQRIVRGLATFAADSELGGYLRIKCVDAVGAFEFLIRTQDWSGRVEPDATFGCDYVIRLASPH